MQITTIDIQLRYKIADEKLPILPQELDLLEALYLEFVLSNADLSDLSDLSDSGSLPQTVVEEGADSTLNSESDR